MWELHPWGLEAEHFFRLPCLPPFFAVKYFQEKRENSAIIKENATKHPTPPKQNKTESIE